MRLFDRCLILAFSALLPSSCHRSGTWEESAGNWERAFNGQKKPPDVAVHHSHYWRSPHFTYEAGYFFELSAPDQFLAEWVRLHKLKAMIPGSQTVSPTPHAPIWFTPKSIENYDLWIGDEALPTFRLYQDRSNKRIFVCDSS